MNFVIVQVVSHVEAEHLAVGGGAQDDLADTHELETALEPLLGLVGVQGEPRHERVEVVELVLARGELLLEVVDPDVVLVDVHRPEVERGDEGETHGQEDTHWDHPCRRVKRAGCRFDFSD